MESCNYLKIWFRMWWRRCAKTSKLMPWMVVGVVHLHRWRKFTYRIFPQLETWNSKETHSEKIPIKRNGKWHSKWNNGIRNRRTERHSGNHIYYIWVRETGSHWMDPSHANYAEYIYRPAKNAVFAMWSKNIIHQAKNSCNQYSLIPEKPAWKLKLLEFHVRFFFVCAKNGQYLYPLQRIYGVSTERKMKFVRLQFQNDYLEAEPSWSIRSSLFISQCGSFESSTTKNQQR